MIIEINNKKSKLTDININPLRGDDPRVQSRFDYKPKVIKYLMIGESPPAGGDFFYHGDSILFKSTLKAFQTIDSKLNEVDFLTYLKGVGFYLDDLCEEPVNHLNDNDRYTLRYKYEPILKKKLGNINPEIIFYTPKTYLKEHIERVLQNINMNSELVPLSFPTRPEHKKEFIETLSQKLKKILEC